MTFEEYCKTNNDNIYKALLGYIPDRAPFEHYKMVSDYTHRRGKYARPNLALLWCELFGGKKEDVAHFAYGIQLAEDWFLMHDDWEDRNELRRGKPTAHKLYGDTFAVNAGDAAHAIMWKIAHDGAKIPNTETGEKLFEKFYDIITVTIEGQYYDMKLVSEKDITKFSLEDYWQSIHAKAAYYSVYGPMQLGAMAAGKNEEEVAKIVKYGLAIGRAFQTKDDILDCTSTEEILGKTIGNDVLEGTKTPILWHFVENAPLEQVEFVKSVYRKERHEKTATEVTKILNLFKENGSVEFAEKLVDGLAEEALNEFENQTATIKSALKETARDAITKLAKRKK